ncbi:MAG: PKD domain-containing protein [Saprospiraceae bacterium]|nr:PKD domain-containing protein [Saprospiraceae bacterium]MBK8372610.1 PKD domain-containing protein [Saprospiraceae bacterium]MBK8855207.1 PKD domain-containing protein [Saprospiraceae bacterium]
MKSNFIKFLAMLVLPMFVASCNKDDTPSNKIPVISAIQVNPASTAANGVVNITVLAVDPDGDQLTYSYVVTGGAINGIGPNVSWTAPSTPGAHSVTVTVSDGKGGTATGNGSLTVQQAITQITGTARFLAGTAGDLSNAKVSMYTTRDNWVNNNPIKFGAVNGVGAVVTFSLTNINPGNYYVDVWKDNDNNGFWSAGDFVGIYGNLNLGADGLTEVQVGQGQTVSINIDMIIL